MQIARENIKTLIKAQGGKLMSCTFTKKDQTERNMTFRLGVKKGLKGGSNKVEAIDRPYLTVYDMKKCGFRTINISSMKRIKINGTQYEVST